MFRSLYLFYLLTAGVEGVYLHLITLRHTPQSVGLLWTRDRPVAETSTWQHKNSQETNIHAPSGFEPTIPTSIRPQTCAFRPRGHWDRLLFDVLCANNKMKLSLLLVSCLYFSENITRQRSWFFPNDFSPRNYVLHTSWSGLLVYGPVITFWCNRWYLNIQKDGSHEGSLNIYRHVSVEE
jgi:hypothetical protein